MNTKEEEQENPINKTKDPIKATNANKTLINTVEEAERIIEENGRMDNKNNDNNE